MNLWKENNLAGIQDLLEYVLSIWLDNGGYSFSHKNNIAYHELLNSIKRNELNRRAVHKTLTEMKANSKNKLDEFSDAYYSIKKELASKKPVKTKWIFFIPIEAEFENTFNYPISITLLGNKFQFVNKISHSKRLLSTLPFRLYDYEKQVKEHLTNPNMIFLSVTSYGEDWYSAWESITPSFDLLRGAIEFSFSFRGFQMSSKSKPRAIIPHPKWLIIRDDKNVFDGTTFNVQDYKIISKFKFTPKHIKVIKNNTRTLKGEYSPNSSKQLLVSCLRLYSDAMDGYYYYNQFLSLWNIAEAICLSGDFGSESKKVANKLAWFGKDIGLVATGISNIMDSLSDKRNDLVHRGLSDINEDDINHLKFAIDMALLWLYRSLTKFKTLKHLSHYYRLRDTNKTELNAISETISIINKLR